MAKAKPQVKSTQSFLTMSEIKSATLLMDDGTYLAVIAVSSTNFALKSEEEQNALVYGYQNFLNSLDFNIQILMQSRKMDIHAYLEKVKAIMEHQTNELLRVQTAEYIDFVSKLIENASIMNKNFYVIVPYNNLELKVKRGGFLSFLKKSDVASRASEDQKMFQENKLRLEQRVNTVIAGLSALGLRSMQLKTQEIIELLYNAYNFGAGPLLNVDKLEDIKIRSK